MVNCHSFICVKAQPLYHVSADNVAGPVDPMCTVYPSYLVFILAFLKEAFQSIKKPVHNIIIRDIVTLCEYLLMSYALTSEFKCSVVFFGKRKVYNHS